MELCKDTMRTPDFRGKIRRNMSFHFSQIPITTLSDILGANADELICQNFSWWKWFQYIFHSSFQGANVQMKLTVLIMGCFGFLGFHWFSKILTLGRQFYLLENTSMATSTRKKCHVCNQDEAICSHQIPFWKELKKKNQVTSRENSSRKI